MGKAKILLAEDDTDLGTVLSQYLELQGYSVILARNGVDALEQFHKAGVDLCILDVMMPKRDGFEVAAQIAEQSPQTPFIFLTAKGMKEDRLRGLKLGADDYICKPFEADELVLRIQNILKRAQPGVTDNYQVGSCILDFGNLTLKGCEGELTLTVKEAKLLKYFISNQNRLVKRESILVDLWGENDYFLGRSMDVFVSRLRKFLQHDKRISIETVRGVGYIFRVK